MTVTHQHPNYDSEQERLDQLQRLKRTCTTQIHNQRTKEKSA